MTILAGVPIYEYKCLKCGKQYEVTQKMSDPPLSKCPDCRGKMKKLMSLAGFHLKGGGWYKDGYASASPKTETKSESSESKESTQPSQTASPPPSKDAPQAPPKKETPDPKPAKAASPPRAEKS